MDTLPYSFICGLHEKKIEEKKMASNCRRDISEATDEEKRIWETPGYILPSLTETEVTQIPLKETTWQRN